MKYCVGFSSRTTRRTVEEGNQGLLTLLVYRNHALDTSAAFSAIEAQIPQKPLLQDLASFKPKSQKALSCNGFNLKPTTFGTSANLVHWCIHSSNDNLDVGSPAHTSTHICARVPFNSIIIRNRSLTHPLTWKHNSGVKRGMDMHANWRM